MDVHVIREQSIVDFYAEHSIAQPPFEAWFAKLKRADWSNPNDILATFGSADLLGKGTSRVVFNIGGNDYRMICRYKFARTMVHISIKYIDTHAEYDKLGGVGKNKKKRAQELNQYNVNRY